jgi:D-threo-aldose 1-dehydrogenase
MQQVQVGRRSLWLPRFGLGTGLLANGGETVAVETIQTALAQGITFFDTAPLYGLGRAEIYLGRALAGVPRENFSLATKVGRLIRDGRAIFDFSRAAIRQSLSESLERLQLDYVDVVHIHDPDDHFAVALAEAFPTLAELRDQGVIKAIGAGMNQWQMEWELARQADFDCFLLAGRYTLLEQTSLDFLSFCRDKGIAIILGGVYNSGILAGELSPAARYNYQAAPAEILTRARQIAAVCDRHNVPLNVAALHFPFLNPAVTSIVVGAEAPAHVAHNLAAFSRPVPAALWLDLKQAGLLHPDTPLV